MIVYSIIEEEFGKTYFGAKVDVLIGGSTEAKIVYQMPDRFKNIEEYSLLSQKQSGTKDIPFRVTIKTPEGEFTQEDILKKDATYTLGQEK